MSALLWRALLAVVFVALMFALLPPLLRVFGIDLSGDLLLVIRICIGGLAILYVLNGPDYPRAPIA